MIKLLKTYIFKSKIKNNKYIKCKKSIKNNFKLIKPLINKFYIIL
jgi:hypothetical protein